MAFTTGQVYAIVGVAIALIFLIFLSFFLWCYSWRTRAGRFQKVSDKFKKQQVVNTGPPAIKVNTIEFTLPQSSFKRQFSRKESQTSEEKLSNEDSKSRGSTDSDSLHDETGVVSTKLGLLKPELYRSPDESEHELENDFPPGNNGRVYFSLEYDVQSEKLIVTVNQIKNLMGRAQTLSSTLSCDPFIRLYLLPDEKRYLQSKMKRKSRNPYFDETFIFTMSYSLLIDRTLRITVFDVDRFMRQTVIGHVLYPLRDFDITAITQITRDIEKFSQLCNSSGRLQVGLTHFPGLNRVAVNLIRGLQIGEADGGTPPDTYVKISYSVLSKTHKTKKTSVYKTSYAPFFNQTVEFKVDTCALDSACMNFEVFQHTSGIKTDRSLGSFIIGGSLCARGKELEHWENMLQKPQTVVKEWHDLKR